jgi:Leucine-rich repeat (LRR) protein
MKSAALLSFTFFCCVTFGQYTSIPDPNFEQALLDQGIDDIIDGQVLTNNISGIAILDVSSRNILNLTGIQDFVSLNQLNCSNNQLTELYPYLNSNLFILNCSNNQLTSLDVSQNYFQNLNCSNNQISNLDISNHYELQVINCANNQLSSLYTSQNHNLKNLNCSKNFIATLDLHINYNLQVLNCSDNQLSFLDLSYCQIQVLNCSSNQLTCLSLTNCSINNSLFDISDNPFLTCVHVDNVNFATANLTQKDEQHYFSNVCGCSSFAGLPEIMTNKETIKVLDLLGREVNPEPNEVLIFLYSDGTSEKIIKTE